MVIKLILIRHGETDANVMRLVQGITDVSLNALGNLQSERVAEYLSNTRIDIIFSSNLKRAVQTSEKICKYNDMCMNIDERLVELDMGIFSGYTRKTLKEIYPEEYKKYIKNKNYVIPNGESYENFESRVLEGLYEILGKCPNGSTICIVSHGGVMECINRHINSKINANKKHNKIIFSNASISELYYDGTWEIGFWNSVDHLIL